jgi:ethanolamine permease
MVAAGAKRGQMTLNKTSEKTASIRTQGVDYEHVETKYLEERRLKRHAGPILLWGLGVGAVISGDYFGWNFGLSAGGFLGLAIATFLVALKYVTMMFSISELSVALPHAGGPYSFSRQAMGPWGGYICGLAVVFEYVLTPAVIVVGIGGYLHAIIPAIPVEIWWLIAYIIFVGINCWGIELTLWISLVVTFLAASILIVFYIAAIPHFKAELLFNIPPDLGQSPIFPRGLLSGVLKAIPFAIWFYLAIEELPLAAEETKDVARDMPKGIHSAMATLIVLSACTLILNTGIGLGANRIGVSDAPLNDGFVAIFGVGKTATVLTLIGLTGLVASFHSIIYAYGRQVYALSRAGYFPRLWSRTLPNRKTPYIALIGGAIIGYGVAFAIKYAQKVGAEQVGAALLNMAVFGAVVSHLMMMISYIILKKKTFVRPYQSPGGNLFAWISILLTVVCFISCFSNPDYRTGVWGTCIFYLFGLGYFGFYSKNHLVAEAPEEEFAVIKAAEKELVKE